MINKYTIFVTIFLVFILLILFLRYQYIHKIEDKKINDRLKPIFDEIDSKNKLDKNIIPNTIFQTYFDKKRIPNKIQENLKKFAGNYKRVLFDDKDALKFLLENFGNIFVDKFKSMKKGAHKADLLRYCYLYINGGIYIDIKTELLINLDEIIYDKKNKLYTVLSYFNSNYISNYINSAYQGFIAVPPNNFFIKEIIYRYMYIDTKFINNELFYNYLLFCQQFYMILAKYAKTKFLKVGIYKINNFSFELFKEVNDCSNNKNKDRYGYCVTIRNNCNKKLMNCRYPDFPW